MVAAHHKMDNLISAIDWNGQQIDGPTLEVMHLGDLRAKWEAFGWEVMDLPDGNDMEAVINALEYARTLTGKGKPVMILMVTAMGKGVDFMEGSERKSVVEGKSGSVRVDLGGRRIIKKKNSQTQE